jgi:hypothetical protein
VALLQNDMDLPDPEMGWSRRAMDFHIWHSEVT